MIRRAGFVLLCHLLAVAFALLGGFLLRWQLAWVWLHAPVALWFALVNLLDWTCPLTTLEKRLRLREAEGSYEGGFIQHYLGPHAGAGWTTRQLERAVGVFFLVWNGAVYAWVFGTGPGLRWP